MDKLIKKRIQAHINSKEKLAPEDLFNRLALFICDIEDSTSDLDILAKYIPNQYLKPVIKHFSDSVIKIPKSQVFEDSALLAVVYYLYGVKRLSWSQIREIMDYDTYFKGHNFISLGKKIQKLKSMLSRNLAQQLNDLNLEQAVVAILKSDIGKAS